MKPKLRLSRLRDIGWSLWDPIGLLGENEAWEHTSFADEYDSYLIHAASLLRKNTAENTVIEYLIHIEIEYMGLGASPSMWRRTKAVVKAIQADSELWTLPPDQLHQRE